MIFTYCDGKRYFSRDLEKDEIFAFRVYDGGKIGSISFILSKKGIVKIEK